VAGALRPVVVLMLLASVLFVSAGVLDGVYPGGDSSLGDLAAISYLFALVNTFVAILVARGSERSLALRMGLSLFFVFERPVSAFAIGSKSSASIAVHLLTAVVELVILVSAIRVWRLGHSVGAGEIEQLFALDSPMPVPAPAAEPEEAPAPPKGTLPTRTAWLIGVTTLLLAAVLVADGIVSGFLPDGKPWGLTGESTGWLVYLFAVVVLAVATRAVKGGRLALRLLAVTALIFFLERAFSPFVEKIVDPVILGLHGLAALIALSVALAAANAIRNGGLRTERDVPTLEAA
jgi:hypothetical protein